ncbi:MAG TPA: histidinol-phosphate aminotransferase, partial [Syntrophobacteraceae bacterium]|nr:histidinol-phosphate aminotransferase [Syntrophobacteraceae bacterium]
PTGTYWNERQLRSFLDRIAGRQIVVVDEAYFEFVEQPDCPNGIALLREYPNLVVFRTFSKMYGLAGLRIGYLVGDLEVVSVIRRTCVVYSVNSVAQAAALAALDDDQDHILRTRELARSEKAFLEHELHILGLRTVIGEGNFVMVKLPMNDGLAYRKLMTHGIMVRSMTGFRFPNWVRISVAKHEAMEAFMEALAIILRKAVH